MAEKHKSKYKAPKDADKSTKPSPRKDLKDYEGDETENMVPNSTGEKQSNVLRKTDKSVIDNGSQVPEIKDADRKYDVTGEKHDPKKAAKVTANRQDHDEKDAEAEVHDEKENLVREYIRQKVRAIVAEEFNEQVETNTELEVNGYPTRHFDMCPAAVQMFNNIDLEGVDLHKLMQLAIAHDGLFMIEKNPQKLLDPLGMGKRLFKKIVNIAKELGVEDQVMTYLPQHLKIIKQKVDQLKDQEQEEQ